MPPASAPSSAARGPVGEATRARGRVARLRGVRTRILVGSVVLLSLALGSSVLITRQMLLVRIDERIEDEDRRVARQNSRRAGSLIDEMPTDPAPRRHEACLELSVEELLRRARPLPPREETVIEDLTEEEAEAFFEAINRD
ncbi:MAG: hypothetical protein JJE52_12700 [Acidimicrobiia bacterium]|nr:hypothetical protein [Acidimicrobiia bacterium]